MGLATIDDTKIRCTSFNVNPNQDVLFYNHVIGLKDTIPTDSATKGEDLGSTYANVQRKIWRPSPIAITGGMSFPATDKNVKDMFLKARYANYFDLDFAYYCGTGSEGGRKFKDCRIADYDFNVTSGDLLNVSTTIHAKNIEDGDGFSSYTTAEKLITWDAVKITVTSAPFTIDSDIISGFNFKINNNIQTIYVAKSSDPVTDSSLLPHDLRVGMQEITGSITIYLEQGKEFIPINLDTVAKINIQILNTYTITIDAVFKSNQIEGMVGPIITQLPFVGVDMGLS